MSEKVEEIKVSRVRWAYRLLRVTLMIVAAYWLSRTGDAFFYQGF